MFVLWVRLSFDGNIFINKLIFGSDGKLIDIRPTSYDWDDDGKIRGVQGKNTGLRELCVKYGVPLEDSVFVGDDDNDFKAMRIAGTKILYHSCDPNDKILGDGCRELPTGVKVIMENDLMKVVDLILRPTNFTQNDKLPDKKPNFTQIKNKPKGNSARPFLFVTANAHERDAFHAHFVHTQDNYIMGKRYELGTFGKYATAYIHIEKQGPNDPEAIPLVSKLIGKLNPVAVVMVGIAFGVNDNVQKIGDVLVSEHILPYDYEKIRADNSEYRNFPKEAGFQLLNAFRDYYRWKYDLHDSQTSNVWVGAVLTGSKLIDNYKFREKLLKAFHKNNPIGGEMEAYGIYSGCKFYGVPEWIIVKGICDWGYNKGNSDKDKHQIIAANAAADYCLHVFNRNGVFDDLVTNKR